MIALTSVMISPLIINILHRGEEVVKIYADYD